MQINTQGHGTNHSPWHYMISVHSKYNTPVAGLTPKNQRTWILDEDPDT